MPDGHNSNMAIDCNRNHVSSIEDKHVNSRTGETAWTKPDARSGSAFAARCSEAPIRKAGPLAHQIPEHIRRVYRRPLLGKRLSAPRPRPQDAQHAQSGDAVGHGALDRVRGPRARRAQQLRQRGLDHRDRPAGQRLCRRPHRRRGHARRRAGREGLSRQGRMNGAVIRSGHV